MNQLDRITYSIGYIVITIGGGILFLLAIIKIVSPLPEKVVHIIFSIGEIIILLLGIIGFIYYLWLAIK